MKNKEIENLWSKNIFDTGNKDLPINVLKQQAHYFNEMTDGLLLAQVKSKRVDIPTHNKEEGTTQIESKIRHSLQIVAPKIDNYYFSIVKLYQDELTPYPVSITSPITKSIWKRNITNQQELEKKLKDLFNNEKVIEVLQALLSQSKNVEG